MTVLLMGILVGAVILDLRTYRIPNFFILASLLSGLLGTAVLGGPKVAFSAIVNSLIICISLFLLYLMKALGAGDVKLFAVIAVFEGRKATYEILIVSMVVGAILGLMKVVVIQIYRLVEKGGKRNSQIQFNKNTPTKLRHLKELSQRKTRNRIHFSIPILTAVLISKGGIF
ncbi:MAG: A24 family peptidase [Lachnospiraceae bacterium]|nr:A24 family peptidase [Lachnospiraceae bacterium]